MDHTDRNPPRVKEKRGNKEPSGESQDPRGPASFDRNQEMLIAELRASLNEAIERALEAEERCAESLPLVYLSVDHAWRVSDANGAACQLWGKTKEELLASDLWSLVDKRRGSYSSYIAALRANRALDFEQFSPVLHKWLQVHATPKVRGLRLWFRDLTAEKSQIQAHAQAWLYYKSLADNVPDIIMRFDTNSRCLFLNRAARDTFDVDEKRYLNKDLSVLNLTPQDAERLRALLRQVFEAKEPICEEFEVALLGTPRYISWRFIPEYEKVRLIIDHVLVMGQDITERRSLEERLQQAQKMEAIGTLAGGIAHDFNNMLAVIIGNAELVLDELNEDPSDSRHSIEQILTASRRSRDLVKQILAFSAKAERRKRPLRLASVVEETIGLLRGSLPSSIEIQLDAATGEDTILGNSSQLQQILMNLASNAAHAMRDEGGTLTIGISRTEFKNGQSVPANDMRPGPYVKLTVHDTGPGIPRAIRDRIFEPFFTTKEAGEGTGMGLAVVYGIVRSHDGAIILDSRTGKGTTFTLFFPASSTEEKAGRKQGAAPTGQERILLIDDEPSLVETVAKTLGHLGYQVTTATSAAEGWKTFEKNSDSFDLVITDQVMPGMSGTKLAEKMIALRKDLPIILFTGYSDTASPEKAQALGISEFLLKPTAKNELARSVRRALDGEKR